MTPTILLIGKNGQLGGELLRCLPGVGEVVAPGRDQLDLSKPNDIRRTIRENEPRIIVNAAAYTAVDQAEADIAIARKINEEASGVIATEAAKIDASVVHYSTDYVFDGSKGTPYQETDSANPLNAYGKTKLAGEQAIRSSGVAHLIFRTSWIYATRGRNFLLTILRLATEREELRIVSDQLGAPTCAADLADATCKVLAHILHRNHDQFVFSGASGTYHMSAAGQTTWYDFAKAILEEARGVSSDLPWFADATNGRPLIARRIIPISSKDYHSPARRPLYSVLSNARLAETFGVALPHWRDQLKQCFVPSSIPANLLRNN